VIYKDTVIEPLTKWIFTLSEESQQRLFSCISHLITLTLKHEWMGYSVCNLCERFTKTHINQEQMQIAFEIIDSMIKQMEAAVGE
jgi:hypothetical protein